jgi:hypothetical protein
MNIFLRMYEEKIELNLHFNNLIPDLINSPKNLTYDAFTYYNYDNSFLIYNSIMNNRLYIVYTTQDADSGVLIVEPNTLSGINLI